MKIFDTLILHFDFWFLNYEFVLNESEAQTILIFGTKLSPDKSSVQNPLVSKLLRTF